MRNATLIVLALLTSYATATADSDLYHDTLRTRTVGIPSFLDGAVTYDPSFDWAYSTGPGQAIYQIPLDGGMRPRFVSVEVSGIPGLSANPVTITAIVVDHSGTKRTTSATDPGTGGFLHWVDLNVLTIIGPNGNALPRASQAILTIRLEFSNTNIRARRVVMFYDRPTIPPDTEPFPDLDPNTLGDLARIVNLW